MITMKYYEHKKAQRFYGHAKKTGLRIRIRNVFLGSGSGSGIIIPDPDLTDVKTNLKVRNPKIKNSDPDPE